jgi:hypothetical protein
MDLKAWCEQQLSALAVIGFCTFPHGRPELQKVPCNGGSQEKLGEYWGLLGQMYCDGLELQLTSRELNHKWVEGGTSSVARICNLDFLHSDNLCCIFPSTFLNCKTCQICLLVYYTSGWVLCGRHSPSTWYLYLSDEWARLAVKNGHHKYT